MILRRLSGHVRAQNWVAVGLDFLIVVVGVYLGVALGDWSDARRDRALAADYLARVHADLVAAAAASEAMADDYGRDAALYEEMLVALETCEALPPRPTPACPVSEGRFAMGLYRTGKHDRPPGHGHTLTEMTASGQLRLIADADLRGALTAVMSEAEGTASIYEQIDARVLPYTNTVEQRVRVRAPNDGVAGIDRGAGTFDPALIDFDYEGLRADPLVRGALSGLRHAQGFLEVLARRNAEAFRVAAARIEEETGAR